MDNEINEIIENESSDLKVIYIHYVGTNSEGLNVYHFLVGENEEEVFGEEWGEKPACNCNNLMPEEEYYEYIKELKTNIVFDLAQKNCCFSMSDCRDGCVALASENIDTYEEYPEPFRLVFRFGESLDEVETKLAKRDLRMKYV